MEWVEVQIHTTHEAMEPLTNILNEFGANGVVIKDSANLKKKRVPLFGEIYELDKQNFPNDGVYVKAYFINNEQFTNKLKKIKQKITELKAFGIDIGENNLSTELIAEEDWETSWKKYYEPTEITDQITIVPDWETYEATKKDEIIVKMDPGMAFGTGTHPTTKLSVNALEKYLNKNDDVIDVGCGSGILSIISARLGANHVYAYDLDEVAVTSTNANSSLNNLTDKITVEKNNLLKGIDRKANIIIANILTHILIELLKDVHENLAENGRLILSGIIEKKENEILHWLEKDHFKVIDRMKEEEWITLVVEKP